MYAPYQLAYTLTSTVIGAGHSAASPSATKRSRQPSRGASSSAQGRDPLAVARIVRGPPRGTVQGRRREQGLPHGGVDVHVTQVAVVACDREPLVQALHDAVPPPQGHRIGDIPAAPAPRRRAQRA